MLSMSTHHRFLLSLFLSLSLVLWLTASAQAAESSWPQQEAGAEAAGFTETGIDQLDEAMRELLNHTAGFGYDLFGDDPVNTAFREQGVLASRDLDELIEKVVDIPLLAQPGEQWYYSIGVDIQGYIVQQIAGMPFGQFLQERILNRWI